MKDLGYYFSFSDYWDLAVKGSIYSKGSYMGDAAARYEKRYKHSGNFLLSYASTNDPSLVEGTRAAVPAKDFRIHWRHKQRPEANPGTIFSASVDAGSSGYAQRTAAGGTYDVTQITQNTLRSSITYDKDLGVFNLTTGLTHEQDLLKRTISLTLPSFSLNLVNQVFPFNKIGPAGQQKWYQKIGFNYTMDGINSINTTDELLFKSGGLSKFQNGIRHNIPINLSLNAFKYFQVSPKVTYTERWYTQSIRKTYMGGTTPTIATDNVPGFSRVNDYSFGVGVSTQLFGRVNFKKGNIVAIRHVMKPSVSLNYTPDFGSDKFGYYRPIENAPADVNGKIPRYATFEQSPYTGPTSGRVVSLGFGLNNNIEAKRKAKQDTTSSAKTTKKADGFDKVQLIRDFSFSGNYNFAADEFRLSVINFTGSTALFKQLLAVNVDGTLDPYQLDEEKGTRINKYVFGNGGLARLTKISFALGLNINNEALKANSKKRTNTLGNMTPQQAEDLAQINRDQAAFVDFNVPWNLTMSYNLQYAKPLLTSYTVSTLNFSGDLNVTPKWKVEFSSGYDFKAKEFTFPKFTFYRDLHCWDLSFSWVPSGFYRNYTVDLKVKASVLQDLKLSKRRNFNTNF